MRLEKSKRFEMDLTTGPVFKNLVIFTLPIIASSLLQQFYSTADQMVVGRFAGDTALAAVGSTGYITNLILNLFVGMSTGATVTCAKFYGAKNRDGVQRTVHTSVALALASGIFLALVGVLFAKPLLAMLDTPADVIDSAALYMAIIFAGNPFSMLYNYCSGILRAAGDTKRPLYILGVTGFINVVLNFVFVIFFKMDVVGVALSTVISQMISSAAAVFLLVKQEDYIKLDLKKIRFHKDELFNIVKIGVPTGLNAILYNIANLTLQSSINSFGKEYMAANTAGSSITNYIALPQNALGTATVSFVGQNYGAKKYKRIHKVVLTALATNFVLSTVLAVGVSLIPQFLLGLFTTEEAVIRIGVGRVLIMGFGYIVDGPTAIYAPALRGMEKSKTPMFLNIIAICFSRIVWLKLVFPLYPVFNMLFVCFPVSWAISSIFMGTAYYLHRRKLPKTDE